MSSLKKLKHFYESQQLDRDLMESLFEKADDIMKNSGNYFGKQKGKILASVFYEPSTRTRFSFESAMIKLGGGVIGTENASEFSSASKGESLEDSIRVVGKYSDIIILRHKETGSAEKAAEVSSVPVINAGDGKGQHPTQALLDVYTIRRELGRIDDLKIAAVGDLANGRTIRSLCYLLGKLGKGNKFIFVSPKELKMKDDIKEYLGKYNVEFEESSDLNSVLSEADVIYMTRTQKERMSANEINSFSGGFVIDENNLKNVKGHARVLHPLPHVEEIDLKVETEKSDKRIAYFRQAENGLFVRMALLDYLLG
jgi:aspartate carbamoyltransferase catalytic subunit